MKKTSKKHNFLVCIILLFCLCWSSNAQANENLGIIFEREPLFTENNFLPGDSVSGWIRVKNNTESIQRIFIDSENVSDPVNLGQVLQLKIAEGSSVLFDNTLDNLFNSSNIHLSDLSPGEQVQYDFTITFDSLAGNKYQGAFLQFDLTIGTLSSSEEEEEGEVEGETTAVFVGGRGVLLPSFRIFNVRATNITQTSAIITWQTNFSATSQVIYSSEGENHEFDPLNPPKYGYQHLYPEPEDSTLVTFHSILLSSLEPCTSYYFRVISHQPSRAPSISQEYQFQTFCVSKEEQQEEQQQAEEQQTQKQEEQEKESKKSQEQKRETELLTGREQSERVSKQTPAILYETEEEPTSSHFSQEIPKSKPLSQESQTFLASALASIGSILGDFGKFLNSCIPNLWLILIFTIIPFIKITQVYLQLKKETNPQLKKQYQKQIILWLITFLLPVILFLIFYFLKKYCLPNWIFIILIVLTFLSWRLDNKIKKGQTGQ